MRFNLEACSILIVDADEVGAKIVVEMLRGLGARDVIVRSSPQLAREALMAHEFHLILLDPAPFGAEGYGLVPWIRRDLPAPNRYAQVLLDTGHTQRGQIAAARDSGANFVIAKPIQPAVLVERLAWLGREKRAFLECPSYIGPERRFRNSGPPLGAMGRRAEDIAALERFSHLQQLKQSDVDSIMDPTRPSA